MERHENEPSGDQNHGRGDEKEKDINPKHETRNPKQIQNPKFK
jgi:hypothetical protein